jgi:Holliday junction resolvase RusA-like endonuclease
MKSIYIPGIPAAKMRPRTTKRGHVYDPNAGAKEASIQKAVLSGDTEVYEGPLCARFSFVFPRPKKHYRTGKLSNVLRDDAPKHAHEISKDVDNMSKFYMDAFNFIHYRDDRQIVEALSKKRWALEGETPHVNMVIDKLG